MPITATPKIWMNGSLVDWADANVHILTHTLHYGFIAQEYKEHMPDATYFDENLGKLCIDTGELIGLLVRSIQQLETRIQRMEAKEALAGVK